MQGTEEALLMRGIAVAVAAALAGWLFASAGVAQAAEETTDWPCAQRRAGTISVAAVWAGPDIAQAGAWDQDADAAELARKLASRRTPTEDFDGLLDAFVAKAGADERELRLTRVFAGALELINAERDRVLSGIVRYARGQSRLAQQVRKDAEDVSDAMEAKDGPPKDEAPNDGHAKTLEDARTRFKWDKRIFDERSRSLTYVCETPSQLERRAFEIARRIQQRL
jgi:hypothetical protein